MAVEGAQDPSPVRQHGGGLGWGLRARAPTRDAPTALASGFRQNAGEEFRHIQYHIDDGALTDL